MRWRIALAVALGVAAIVACKDNPNIDGKKVPASAATCTDVCNRLVALCGYAPSDDCTDADGGGYCDLNLGDYLDCMSTATSCQSAWDCTTVTAPTDDGGDESSTDDGGDEASTDDAATDDAPAE